MTALLLLLGGPFGRWIAYGAAALAVVLVSGWGFDRAWTIPRLESRAERAEKGWEAEKTGRLADRAVASEAARKQEAEHRATEQRWAAKLKETEDETAAQVAAARRDAAAAGVAAGRLRDALATARAAASRAAQGSATPAECKAAGETGVVLSDVLGRLEERGRELAAYADSARIAGDACLNAWPVEK